MKFILALLFVGAVTAQTSDFFSRVKRDTSSDKRCVSKAEECCKDPSSNCKTACSSLILEETHYDDFVKYANENLVKNFEYLFLAAQFSTFTKDRPGFEKVFHGLADSAWNKGLDMIKEISKRGVTHSFEKMSETAAVKVPESQNEVKAMAEASEIEKKLLEGAMNVFRHHSHASKKEEEAKASGFDAGIAHFVEEEIIEGKTETVRTLVGHVNDLMKLVEVNKAEDGTDIPSVSSLGIYLFDQYLQK